MILDCPMPHGPGDRILMSHGGGGRHGRMLLEQVFYKHFDQAPGPHHDAAFMNVDTTALAMTTDSYVIHPLFFPGGDIGSMAVHGTVNDLAVAGAQPYRLSAAFILEESLPIAQLTRVVVSMAAAAKAVGVPIVTGDTKVVERGKCDGLYINTTGLGLLRTPTPTGPRQIQAGDAILLNGDLGRHGIAVMAFRAGLSFETDLQSDSAPIWNQVQPLIEAGLEIHCMRDLTRGGLGAALQELADDAELGIRINEPSLPVDHAVAGACEVLGLDPLFVANEGRFITILPRTEVDQALDLLRVAGAQPVVIGEVHEGRGVSLKTTLGTHHRMILPGGEQLPRIC